MSFLSAILTDWQVLIGIRGDFCTKNHLSNASVYGIVDLSAGDDDWVPCGAML